MKKATKLLVLVLFLIGVAMAVGLSYYASGDSAPHYDGCPAYATHQSSFMNEASNAYRLAAQVSAQVADKSAALAANNNSVPRNNFIDDFIFGAMERDQIPHADLCTDEEFIRRAYLDLTGRIPAAQDVRDFVAQTDPNKRANLVSTLMSEEPYRSQYVDRWTMFFGDLLQNTYSLLYQGRTPYYNYIRDFVAQNKPYHQFVAELVTSGGYSWADGNGPVNYLARAWENMVNQADVQDNIAVNSGRMFLGVPILCISCHSGPGHLNQVNFYLSDKRRQDLWGLSAFFSGLRFQRTRETQTPNTFSFTFTESPTQGYNVNAAGAQGGIRPQRVAPPEGPIIPPRYFFTGEVPNNGADFRPEFARLLTADFQFARATVNYLWRAMMGVGIVEAPDAFDLARLDPNNPPPAPWTIQPTNPDLLNALAQEFIDNNYDIPHILQLIANSSAYQLSARFNGNWEGRFAPYFARHFAKRMTAEQITDAVFAATGLPGIFDIDGIGQVQWTMQLPDPVEPRGGGNSAIVRNFLNLFMRGNRDTEARRSDGSILQSLALLNNLTVVDRVLTGHDGLSDRLANNPKMTNDQVVEELFLATLSRYPTAEEKALALQKLNADRAAGAETLHLALFNKLDFIFY